MAGAGDGIYIVLNYKTPPPVFIPGQTITGKVVVRTTGKLSTKGVTITLKGEVYGSFWEYYRGYYNSTYYSPSHHHHHHYGHYTRYSDTENPVNQIIYLLGNEESTEYQDIPDGVTEYPFSIQLPYKVPTSFTCKDGNAYVTYTLIGNIGRSWLSFDWTVKYDIPVLAILDLKNYPKTLEPEIFCAEKRFGCCCPGPPLETKCRFEKTGFYPGEVVKFTVSVTNKSGRLVTGLVAELYQIVCIRARRKEKLLPHQLGYAERPEIYNVPIPGETITVQETEWSTELQIPECVPTGLGLEENGRRILFVRYVVKITVKVDGWCKYDPELNCDILVGSKPPPGCLPLPPPNPDLSRSTLASASSSREMSGIIPQNSGLTIFLDNSPPCFLPLQEFSGHVQIRAQDVVKTNGLMITLKGQIHVSFTERVREKKTFGRRSVGGREHSSYEYVTHWRSAHQDIINFPIQLVSGRYDFLPGVYSYPFRFRMPGNLATSFHCARGDVEYSLVAQLVIDWGSDWVTRMVIPVMAIVDLRAFPRSSQSIEIFREAQVGCCCSKKPVKMWLKLPKTGYYPGEFISFQVRFDNKSDQQLRNFKAELCQDITLWAQGHEDKEIRIIQAILRGEYITATPNSGDFWSAQLRVPGVAPSNLGNMRQNLITLRYYLRVYGIVDGECCGSDYPAIVCDIIIGSLPPTR